LKQYLSIFLLSGAGGWFFSLVHMPLPWTLGPLVTVVIVKICFRRPVYWSMKIRNLAMILLGYVMGSPFTFQTCQHVLAQLPAITVITVLTVVLYLGGGYVTGRYLDMGLATSLLGSMPGGLTQMAMVCEEVEGSDAATVTLMQTVRVLTAVFIVPFLVLHGLADRVDPVNLAAAQFYAGDIPRLLLFASVIAVLIGLMRYFKISSPYLIAPIIGTAGLVLSGVNPPAMPVALVALAQVCVGIRMGMAVEVSSLANWKKVVVMNFISVFLVIVAFLGIDYIMARVSSISFVTAFISTAPGGMTEMGLTALMVHADLSTVIAFQLCRLMFVLLIAIPCMRWWLCRSQKSDPCCRS